jgi:hypothetical protein
MLRETRFLVGAVAIMAGLAAFGPPAGAAPLTSVRAFCAANPNNDNPAKAFYGPRLYKPGLVPQDVARSGANAWRCMGGRVLVCNIGADGYACQKLNPNPIPSKPVRDYCAANPGSDFVPMVVIGNSARTWRCAGRMPRPLQTQALDQRNFIRKSWRPLPR